MARFEWDISNISHIALHGVTPVEAEQVILNDPFDLDMQDSDGEERIPQVGATDSGRVLLVVTTWRGESIRVVTAFPAPRALRKLYAAKRGTGYAEGTEEGEFPD
jgi:uncharacterized DUF497 family protein